MQFTSSTFKSKNSTAIVFIKIGVETFFVPLIVTVERECRVKHTLYYYVFFSAQYT